MSTKNQKMYFVKNNKYMYKLFKDLNLDRFKDVDDVPINMFINLGNELNVDAKVLHKLYNDEFKCELIPYGVGNRICEYIKEDFFDVFEKADLTSHVDVDKPFVQVSHEKIRGYENNIINKLEVYKLTSHKIDEIMELIDMIVVESTLFGLELSKKGNTKELQKFKEKIK